MAKPEEKTRQELANELNRPDNTHTYYNIFTRNTTNANAPAVFNETRSTPILANPSHYYMSITRILIPTSQIPIFVFPGYEDEKTASSSPFNVNIRINTTDSVANVKYIPSKLSQAPAYDNGANKNDPYFYVYSYRDFIAMVNNAWTEAFNNASFPTPQKIFSAKVTYGGSGYGGVAPTVSFSVGTATAIANLDITGDFVESVTITSSGGDLLNIPEIQFSSGLATAEVILAPDVWEPPFMKYNDDNTISLITQVAYLSDGSYPISLYMNQPLINFFFGGMRLRNNPQDAGGNHQWQLLVQNLGTNKYDLTNLVTPPYLAPGFEPTAEQSALQGYEMKQEYPSLFAWNDFQTLVVQAGGIPIRNELAPTIDNNFLNGTLIPIVSDFQPIVNTGYDARTLLQYTPSAEYRLLDMQAEAPMFNFNLQFFWRSKNGDLVQVYLAPGESITVKILFRKKNYNAQPLTHITRDLLYEQAKTNNFVLDAGNFHFGQE